MIEKEIEQYLDDGALYGKEREVVYNKLKSIVTKTSNTINTVYEYWDVGYYDSEDLNNDLSNGVIQSVTDLVTPKVVENNRVEFKTTPYKNLNSVTPKCQDSVTPIAVIEVSQRKQLVDTKVSQESVTGVTDNDTNANRSINFDKQKQKWKLRIKINGKWKHIKLFNSKQEALQYV